MLWERSCCCLHTNSSSWLLSGKIVLAVISWSISWKFRPTSWYHELPSGVGKAGRALSALPSPRGISLQGFIAFLKDRFTGHLGQHCCQKKTSLVVLSSQVLLSSYQTLLCQHKHLCGWTRYLTGEVISQKIKFSEISCAFSIFYMNCIIFYIWFTSELCKQFSHKKGENSIEQGEVESDFFFSPGLALFKL